MTKLLITTMVFGAAALAFSACSARGTAVSGQVTYLVRSALPEDAVVTVQIQDTSLADAPADVIGEQVIPADGKQVPIDFAVAYDQTQIVESHRYSLAARIEDAQGQLLFVNDQNIPVITGGAPTSGIEAVLVPVSAAPAGSSSVTATPWLLTRLGANEPLAGTEITAVFNTEGNLSGSAGCNSYTAPYQVSGNNLSFGQTITTLKACDAAIMKQESEYLTALEATTGYAIQGDTLTLADANGAPVAVFSAQSPGLAGTTWLVTGYNNGKGGVVSVMADTVMDATFGTDGNIGGSAGCNDYFAPYTLAGTNITIGPAGSTRKMCAQPEGIMDQEAQYLTALQTAATYELSGSNLTLRAQDGAIAVTLTRAP